MLCWPGFYDKWRIYFFQFVICISVSRSPFLLSHIGSNDTLYSENPELHIFKLSVCFTALCYLTYTGWPSHYFKPTSTEDALFHWDFLEQVPRPEKSLGISISNSTDIINNITTAFWPSITVFISRFQSAVFILCPTNPWRDGPVLFLFNIREKMTRHCHYKW